MSPVESVAQAFATYRAQVIPDDAPSVQVEECRRAFYAGSYFLLMNIAQNIGDDATDEEQGIQELERLKAECETFAATAGASPLPEPVEQSGYNVRHAGVESALREIATEVKAKVPDGFGFTLLLFSYDKIGLAGEGKAGALFYISTARRADMIKAMKEFIARNTQ